MIYDQSVIRLITPDEALLPRRQGTRNETSATSAMARIFQPRFVVVLSGACEAEVNAGSLCGCRKSFLGLYL